jgi:pimeloyl-ACP methyl ester carboxylesterase
VAYDARGFGETTYEPEDGWSQVADAVAVMDAAGLRRAVLVAGSMGGRTALDLALAHPERVSGLVLIGAAVRGAPYPDVTEGPTAELFARAEAAEEAKDFDELGRLEAWIWLDGPHAPEGRVSGAVRDLFLEMNDEALRADDPGEQAETEEAWPRLGAIDVPVLVLVGKLDVEDIQQVDAEAARLIPDARLVWIDDVAHVPHLESDPTTLAEIAAFVDAVPTA